MSIRRKTLLIVFVSLLLFTAILYPIAALVLLRGFAHVEAQDVLQQTARARAIVDDEIRLLASLTRDWAEQDDAYRFVAQQHAYYALTKLSNASIARHELDLLAFTDTADHVVFATGFDQVRGEKTPLTAGVAAQLVPDSTLLRQVVHQGKLAGVVLLPEGPLLVAVQPILPTAGGGPARGYVITGRWLNDRFVAHVAQHLALPLAVARVDAALSEDFDRAHAQLTQPGEMTAQVLTASEIAGYTSLDDIFGQPALLLRTVQPRVIAQQADTTVRTLIVVSILCGLIMGGVGWLLLDRLMLSRIKRLVTAVRSIGVRADPQARVLLPGGDELSGLAQEINGMLDSLEQTQAQQRRAEARYRAVVEQTSEGIILVDAATKRIVDANRACERIIGYSAEELLNRTLYDLVPEERAEIDAFSERRVRGGDYLMRERRQRRKDGSYVDLEVRVSPVMYGDTTLLCFVIRDITERKRIDRRVAALTQLSQRLSAATTAVSAAEIIATTADELIGWDSYALVLYDAQADLLHAVLSFDIIDGERTTVQLSGEGYAPGAIARRTLEEGAQLVFADQPGTRVAGLTAFGDTSRPSASLMFAPIRRGAGAIGIVTVQSYEPHAFTQNDLATLQILADHCGGALERIWFEEALHASEERFRSLVASTPGVIYRCAYDEGWTDEFMSESIEAISGYPASDFINSQVRTFESIMHPDDRDMVRHAVDEAIDQRRPFMVEYRIIHADGSVRWVYEKGHASVDEHGNVRWIDGTILDITEHKQTAARMEKLAYYDELTGLPNRTLFQDRLQQALAQAQRSHELVALLCLDLDRFKFINDTLGHHIGDALLQAVAHRLLDCVREGDTIARMGGDEFTIVLPGLHDMQAAAEVAQRMIEVLSTPLTLDGHDLFVSASIGISLSPNDGHDVGTLLKHADAAMYRAKDLGRNTFQFYTPAMNAVVNRQMEVEQHLRWALERDEFEIFYQPRIDLHSDRLIGMEALLRWQHPRWGMVSPMEFIPLAEETGLIVPIGEWVLRKACAQAKAWQALTPMPLRVSVNLSAQQLQQAGLAAQVARALGDAGLAPMCLELEVTESSAMRHAEHTIVVLRSLKAMGVHLSLDDFGTGYSSLSYLKQFPIDTLKIDRSFVRDLPHDATIAEAVIALAHSLNLTVTAEGVEEDDQLAFLKQHHCDEVQGYLLGKPVAAAEFEALYLGNRARVADAPVHKREA